MAAAEHVAAAQVAQDLGIDPYKSYEEAVHATEPDRTSPEYLAVTHECHAPCELEEKIWHRGVKVWRCEKCGFQTFEESEAEARKPA